MKNKKQNIKELYNETKRISPYALKTHGNALILHSNDLKVFLYILKRKCKNKALKCIYTYVYNTEHIILKKTYISQIPNTLLYR